MPQSSPKRRAQFKASYQKHRAERLAKQRAYHATHTEEARDYKVENQEHIRIYQQAYDLAHRDEKREKERERYRLEGDDMREKKRAASQTPAFRQRRQKWYIENYNDILAVQRQYRADNPQRIRAYKALRRARKLNLPATFTLAEREFMLQYWHHACAVCGNEEGFFWTLADDHVIPLSSDDCPGTVADNLIPLCHGSGGCNNLKHDSALEPWLLSRYPRAKAKRILKAIEAYFAIVRARKLEGATG